MIFRKWGGGGSKAVWNFSENSSVLETASFPYHYDDNENHWWKNVHSSCTFTIWNEIRTSDDDAVASAMMIQMKLRRQRIFMRNLMESAIPSLLFKKNCDEKPWWRDVPMCNSIFFSKTNCKEKPWWRYFPKCSPICDHSPLSPLWAGNPIAHCIAARSNAWFCIFNKFATSSLSLMKEPKRGQNQSRPFFGLSTTCGIFFLPQHHYR